jgi:hypothetical protein
MAVLNHETLVLRGKRDVQNVVARLAGIGFGAAVSQPPAVSPSGQQPSPTDRTGYLTDPRGPLDAEGTAGRAGRSGSWGGAPVRRSPARFAGRTVQLGWSQVQGGPDATAVTCQGLARAQAAGATVLRGRFSSPHDRALRAVRPLMRATPVTTGKRHEEGRGRPEPAGGAPTASTRGKRAG